MSLRLREPVEPAMPRVAAHREGRSGPPAAMSRRIRPYSEGRTPEARKARASQAALASHAGPRGGPARRADGRRTAPSRSPPAAPQRSPRRTWASSWARTGRTATVNRGSRSISTGSRIAGAECADEHRSGHDRAGPHLGDAAQTEGMGQLGGSVSQVGAIDRAGRTAADGSRRSHSPSRQDRRADNPGQPEHEHHAGGTRPMKRGGRGGFASQERDRLRSAGQAWRKVGAAIVSGGGSGEWTAAARAATAEWPR